MWCVLLVLGALFADTTHGYPKKIAVEDTTTAFKYGNIVADKGSALNDHLPNVKVQECTAYRSVGSCLGATDGCGWCFFEDKCSFRANCRNADQSPLYWITSDNLNLAVQEMTNQLPRRPARSIPEVSNIEKLLPVDQKMSNSTTPPIDTVPASSTHQRPESNANSSTFNDCNTYSSCTQCASSSFPCDWCVDGHRCTHDTAENCRNDILVTGVSRIGPSYRSGPGFCPTINSTSDGTNEILVPSGVKKAIKVKVHIIGQFIVQTRFVCQFNIEGRVTRVNAQLLADTVYCEAVEFTYTSRSPNITASFAVIWGGTKVLDNPDNIHILIYRCNDMAENCGTCLSLTEKFGCGWCQGSDTCEVPDKCSAPNKWFEKPTSRCGIP